MLQYPSTLCFRGACFARVCEHFVSADGTGPNVCMTEKKKKVSDLPNLFHSPFPVSGQSTVHSASCGYGVLFPKF